MCIRDRCLDGPEVSRGIANDGLTIMLDEAQNIAVLNANIVEALQDIGFYTTQVTDSRIQVEDISINGNPTLTITFTTGASAPGKPSATITPTQTGIGNLCSCCSVDKTDQYWCPSRLKHNKNPKP